MSSSIFSRLWTASICISAVLAAISHAHAEDAEQWSLHGQATFVEQYQPGFRSLYIGTNSLKPDANGRETFDATLFLGLALWDGGEVYADPEIDQGFGLSNTVGVAGFPSGEAYKVGKSAPYGRLQRLFLRQTFDLGGDEKTVEPGQNQLGGQATADRLVVTMGKLSVTDIFDTNAYAHDPKSDFLNWSIIDSGAFDYAADAWGYSYGVTAEWTESWHTLRAGLFDLSRVPNTTELVRGFGQYEAVVEGEGRYTLGDAPGTIRLLAYVNRGRMGSYNDALALGGVPDMALVRRPAFRPGMALNVEQQIIDGLGGFLRLSWNDGSEEAYEFTEINHSVAAGLALNGAAWDRSGDTLGGAVVVNGISASARRYLAAGGLGILIGDGALLHYDNEAIFETYYKAALTGWLAASADYQAVLNPAYNGDRGPVSVLSARLHAQF